MHIKDHSAAMKFFRTYDTAASKGKWKDFVDEMAFDSMLQKPRTMAQEPRVGFPFGGSATAKKQAAEKAENLKKFVTQFKLDNNGQLPRLTDIQQTLKTTDVTIKKYLTEGEDFRITETVPGGKKYVKMSAEDRKAAYLKSKKPTTTIAKEKNIKILIDDIFDLENWGGFKSETPGVARSEGKIKKHDPSRVGKTGGTIPNQWWEQHFGKAFKDGPGSEAFKDLMRITGRTEAELLQAYDLRKIEGMAIRSGAASWSSAKLKKINKDFAELVKGGMTNKADLMKALKVTDAEIQDLATIAFKNSYTNRAKINKGEKITSYLGNTADEYTDFLDNGLKKIDGIEKSYERLIKSRLNQVYGAKGSHANPEMFKIMNGRINEFYKIKKLLPPEIVMNLDHAIPMSLIEQLTTKNTLRVNVQPITQALNSGLKAQIDKAYSAAYKAGDKVFKNGLTGKEVMRSIEEVANKIDLPMGKLTEAYWDLGKNPFLSGDMKQVIYNNLVIQNSISEKAGKLDKGLLKKAGLDNMSFDVGKVDTEVVAKLFSEGDQKFTKFVSGVGNKIKSGNTLYSFPAVLGDKKFMKQVGKDVGTIGKKGLRFLASDWVWPEIALGLGEYWNLKQKGAEPSRAWKEALEMLTLGIVDLQGTEKAIVDQARKLGYDDEAVKNLELLIQSKQIEKDIRGEYKNFEAIKANLEGDNPDPRLNNWGMVEASQKRLEQLNNDYAGVQENFTGGEEVYKLYDDATQELARTEWNRSLEGRKTRTDPYAGEIGSELEEIFAVTPGWYETQEQIDAMSPEELDKWNLQERGIGYERVHPQYGAAMSYKQMEPFYEQMDYMYKAEGGIMSLKKKW